MSAAIETRSLTRRFGDFVALDRLDLSVPRGEIFGLLGPNAAGKSTAIRLLAGILRADSGEAQVLGLDLFTQTEQIKRRIGYVAQHFALYPDLSALEIIRFYGGLYGIDDVSKARDLLQRYDLAQFSKRRAGLLSGGYQRRLAIAAATMHDPELIFLDEPTAGIDPLTRSQFILGKIIPYVLISLVDFYAILGFSWLVFDLPAPNSHAVLLSLAMTYLAALISMGLAISTVSQTQQQAIFISIFVLIPSILLSGFIFPIEAMPAYIQPVAYIIAFTYFVDIIRGILLKQNPFVELLPQFLALAAFAVVFTSFSILCFRKTLA